MRHYRKKVQKTMKTIQIDNMTYIQDPVDHQFYRLSPEDARRPMSFKRAVKQPQRVLVVLPVHHLGHSVAPGILIIDAGGI